MTTAETLSQLPDDTPCYVPPVGEVTLGEIRATEEEPAVDDPLHDTLEMWAWIAFHPDASPWEDGSTVTRTRDPMTFLSRILHRLLHAGSLTWTLVWMGRGFG